jgi:hypothetical protein
LNASNGWFGCFKLLEELFGRSDYYVYLCKQKPKTNVDMKKIIIGCMMLCALYSCSSEKKEKELTEKNYRLGSQLYEDDGNIVHSILDCNSIYKKNNAQAVFPIKTSHIWTNNSGGYRVCSQCFDKDLIEQLDSVTSSVAYVNRKWLFQSLQDEYYDVGDWKTYNKRLDNKENREALYDFLKDEYDFGTFDDFDYYMTDYKTLYKDKKVGPSKKKP